MCGCDEFCPSWCKHSKSCHSGQVFENGKWRAPQAEKRAPAPDFRAVAERLAKALRKTTARYHLLAHTRNYAWSLCDDFYCTECRRALAEREKIK